MKEKSFSREGKTNDIFHIKAWFSTSFLKDRCHLQVLQRGITQWWIQNLRIKRSPFCMIFQSNFVLSSFFQFFILYNILDLYSWDGCKFFNQISSPYEIRSLKGLNYFWLVILNYNVYRKDCRHIVTYILSFNMRFFLFIQFVQLSLVCDDDQSN